jgi:hypothetical protein
MMMMTMMTKREFAFKANLDKLESVTLGLSRTPEQMGCTDL